MRLNAAASPCSRHRSRLCLTEPAPQGASPQAHNMPCSVLVAAADPSTGRPPLLSHSFDTPGGVDFRLVHVPAAAADAGTPRPVFRFEEESLPRFSGDGRVSLIQSNPYEQTPLPQRVFHGYFLRNCLWIQGRHPSLRWRAGR